MGRIKDTELQRIQLIKKDALEIASALGELQYQKMSIELLIDEEKQKIKELKKSENELFDELVANYGKVNINIETGEFE